MDINSVITLNDGREIPRFGLGVYQANRQDTGRAVYAALQAGYRHIDTAECYRNEEEVGDALHRFLGESKLTREDIWITTKYFPPRGGAEDQRATKAGVSAALQRSLDKLQLDYVDLYLIHSPHNKNNRLHEWASA